jgi:2-iminobutanoate/2-iminopropanoate deaminase
MTSTKWNDMSLERKIISLPASAADAARGAGHPLSFATRAGDFLFVSGLTAVDLATGEPKRGTTASETQQILTNLRELLEDEGSSLKKVVKVNVLLHSMLEAPNMNEVYARFFPDPPPARTVCGARLPDGMKVIIECTALA